MFDLEPHMPVRFDLDLVFVNFIWHSWWVVCGMGGVGDGG